MATALPPSQPRKHAPRGPIKARDPMTGGHPMAGGQRCHAHSRSGAQCKQPAIHGGAVCRYHGGAAPQVQASAQARLLALQFPAIARLGQLVEQTDYPSTAYQAARDVLDRTLGKPKESVDHTGDVTWTVRWQD